MLISIDCGSYIYTFISLFLSVLFEVNTSKHVFAYYNILVSCQAYLAYLDLDTGFLTNTG